MALGLAVVEVGLHLGIGLLSEQVHDRVAQRPDGGQHLVDVVQVAAVADGHGTDPPAVPCLGHERRRRRPGEDQEHRQLPGRLGGDRPIGVEDLLGPLEGPGDEPAVDGRADLMQPERELGDDAEVGAGAADRPEQLGVLVAAGGADLAVGGDDLDLLEVVDGPAEPAGQIAKAAAEGQAGHADLGDEAEHGGQPVLLGRLVDVLEQAAGSDVGEPGIGIDADVAHAGQVEGQAASGDGGAGDVVAAALDAEQQPMVAGEPNRRGHVVGRGRLDDECGDLGGHAVPDQQRVVPAVVAGAEQPPGEL